MAPKKKITLKSRSSRKKKSKKKSVPLSENQRKYHEEWSADDCIKELQRIANLDQDKVITRNYFRIHSKISESTWNRYFGTFAEFKRQAGIVLTRQQHKLERDIAKHASIDHYRQLSDDRKDWGSKYIIERQRRFKTILVASDLHDKEIDKFYLRILLDTAKRLDPDIVCLNGDIFDLPEFSRFHVDPREWDVVNRIKFVHREILSPLRKLCPNSQIDLIEGNHEARLLKHFADSTPALKAVLSDLHGMTIPGILGLDRFEINYIARGDLSAFTIRDQNKQLEKNYKIYYDCVLAHHFPHGKKLGYPGWNGHHHKHQVWPGYSPTFGPFEWHQIGCGHRRNATYCDAQKWHNGFLIAHIDRNTKNSILEYISITDFTCVGGKYYYRKKNEF